MSACADLCEFACRLTLETGAPPHRLMPLVRRLRRLATSHQRRCEVTCNGCRTCEGTGFMFAPIRALGMRSEHMAPAQEGDEGARPCPTCSTDTLEEAIRGVCRDLDALERQFSTADIRNADMRGFVPVFSGDPRGATVRLRLPSGAYNTMGGAEDGWGVPTGRR